MSIGAPAAPLRVHIFRATPRKTPERPCTNCGDPMPGNFCRMCGQRKVEVRVSLGRMLMEVLDDQFSINSALPRTLAGLLFRPGHLTREYMSGRIARYIPPFRLYLVASVAFFVALSMLPELRDPLANAGINQHTTVNVGAPAPPDGSAGEVRSGVPAVPRPVEPADAAAESRGESAQPAAPTSPAVAPAEDRAAAPDGSAARLMPEESGPDAPLAAAADSSREQPRPDSANAAVAATGGGQQPDGSAEAGSQAAGEQQQAVSPSAVAAAPAVEQPASGAPDGAAAEKSGEEPRTRGPIISAGSGEDPQLVAARNRGFRPPAAPGQPQAPSQGASFLDGMKFKMGNAQFDSVMNQRYDYFRSMEPRDAARQLIGGYLDHVPQMMFLMLPLFAALLKLLYVGSKRYYVEHFVFALHLHAFAFTCYLVMIAVRWPPLIAVLWMWMFVYLFAAMKRVYRQGWFVTAMKYGVLGITYSVVVTIAAMLTFVATVLTA